MKIGKNSKILYYCSYETSELMQERMLILFMASYFVISLVMTMKNEIISCLQSGFSRVALNSNEAVDSLVSYISTKVNMTDKPLLMFYKGKMTLIVVENT